MTNVLMVRVYRTAVRHRLTREAGSASISHRSHTQTGFPSSGTGFVYYGAGGRGRD